MDLFRMPRVALNDDEVMVLSSWIVAEGEAVSEGTPIVEVETAKANMEVEAPSAGVLALQLRLAGSEVSPGDVIGVIAEVGEIIDASALHLDDPPAGGEAPVDAGPAEAADGVAVALHGRTDDDLALDDARLDGSGSSGMAPRRPRATAVALAAPDTVELAGLHRRAPRVASGFLIGSVAQRPAPHTASHATLNSKSVAQSRHREALGRLMTASAAIPQFSVHTDVASDEVTALVARLRAAGIAATLTDVLLKAASVALSRYPRFNSQFTGTELREFESVSIGIAVDTDSGVLAPVIHGVEALPWRELARTRKDIVERARNGRVPPANLSGGTFSISNVGPLGAQVLVPMITPPQTAILGIGATHPTAAGSAFTAVIVADHRVHDGADAARFLQAFADALGDADRLILS